MCLFRAARCIHVRFYTRSCATWIYPSLPKYWHIINTFFLLKMFSQHNTNAARNSQKLSIVFRGKTRRTICRSKISGTSSPGRACRSQVSPRRLARPRLGPREVRGSATAAPGGIRCPCTTVRPAQRPAAAPVGLPAAKPARMRSRHPRTSKLAEQAAFKPLRVRKFSFSST